MRFCLDFTNLYPTEGVRVYSCLLQALHDNIMLFSLSNLQHISLKLQTHWIIKLCLCLRGITKKCQVPVTLQSFPCIFTVCKLYSFNLPHWFPMELTGNNSSLKLLASPQYTRLLEVGGSKTSFFSSLILECGWMTLLQYPCPPKNFSSAWEMLQFQLRVRQLTDKLQDSNKNNQQPSGEYITSSNDVDRTKKKYQ